MSDKRKRMMARQEFEGAKRDVLDQLRAELSANRRWSRDSVYPGWARESRIRARLFAVALAAVRKVKS